jgi:hypothetical protein
MSLFLTEQEFERDSAEAAAISINAAFLNDIKTDFRFRDVLNEVYYKFKPPVASEPLPPRLAAALLTDLRDALETYFSLEEFYGYFSDAAVNNPCVNNKANALKEQHRTLFLSLSEILDKAEQIVYREVGPEVTVEQLGDELETFCKSLAEHEEAEMELMMRSCNEDIGVGD